MLAVRPLKGFALGCLTALICLSCANQNPIEIEDVDLFSAQGFKSTNGVSFSSDGRVIYMALRHETEETFSIYAAHDEGGIWSGPQLISFSEKDFDPYEPTIAPDGSFLVFNSRAPWPGVDDPPVDGPRLWATERQGDGWKEPVPLANIANESFASSYATFNESGDLYYFSGSTPIPSRPSGLAGDNGGYLTEAIYFAKKTGSGYGPSEFLADLLPVSAPGQKIGVGDPWISPKGDYIIYTIYDDAIGWRASVDLVISFTSAEGWTPPIKLDAINSDGADNSPSGTPDEEWLYFRNSGQLRRTKLQPLLKSVKPE